MTTPADQPDAVTDAGSSTAADAVTGGGLPTTADLVARIEATADRVRLRNPALGIDVEQLVVEGDLGLSPDAVVPYAAARIELARLVRAEPDVDRQGLVAMERDGGLLRWRRGKVLSYCVQRASFGSDDAYGQVVAAMAEATAEWSSLCHVEFRHDADRDTDPHPAPGDVVFPVIGQSGPSRLVALAFFPDAPVTERQVWIFDGFFATGPGAFDPVGVLRHELGHVLGFRHEHIRPEAPGMFAPESTDHTVDLTPYDPTSVMHYLGPGVGDPRLRFTDRDRAGARHVYGGPDSDYSFAD